MNKRLLHLFNEAGFHQPEMERLGIEQKFEKFAELIVRECIVTLHRRGVEGFGIVEERMLKEHFGVEE